MRTRGFISDVQPEVQADIMAYALRRIRPERPNWVVFYPEGEVGEHLEDEGRTLVTAVKGLAKKVYAILDDFGSPEALRQNMGKYGVGVNTRFVVTFLLAEEY
jgi:hypothetical protein